MHLTACAYERCSWKDAASDEGDVPANCRSPLDPPPLRALSTLAMPIAVVADEPSPLEAISEAEDVHDYEDVQDSRKVAEMLVPSSSDEER